VVERPDLRRAGRGDVEPGGPQRAQQLGLGVGVERGPVQRGGDLGGEVGEPLGPLAAARARAHQPGEQRVVQVGAERHPVVPHLGGDQRAGRLRREQQPEPAVVTRLGERAQLAVQLPRDVRQVGRGGHGAGQVVEQARHIDLVGPGVDALRGSVPRPRGASRHVRARGPGAAAQDRVAQPQIVRALHPHPGGEQVGVPACGVVPHPAGPVDLPLGHRGGQVDARDTLRRADLPRLGGRDVRDGAQHRATRSVRVGGDEDQRHAGHHPSRVRHPGPARPTLGR
jgi:hypothetical protein